VGCWVLGAGFRVQSRIRLWVAGMMPETRALCAAPVLACSIGAAETRAPRCAATAATAARTRFATVSRGIDCGVLRPLVPDHSGRGKP
jgi:hypothetical protein